MEGHKVFSQARVVDLEKKHSDPLRWLGRVGLTVGREDFLLVLTGIIARRAVFAREVEPTVVGQLRVLGLDVGASQLGGRQPRHLCEVARGLREPTRGEIVLPFLVVP